MVNTKLLNDTMAVIKARPQTYDQNTWVNADDELCNTTMCFAGHAAVLAGAEAPDPKVHKISDWYITKDGNKYMNWDTMYYGNVPYVSVRQFATDALSITVDEAGYLFDGDRSFGEIEDAVQDLNETGKIAAAYYDYEDDDDDYDGGCPCCNYDDVPYDDCE